MEERTKSLLANKIEANNTLKKQEKMKLIVLSHQFKNLRVKANKSKIRINTTE